MRRNENMGLTKQDGKLPGIFHYLAGYDSHHAVRHTYGICRNRSIIANKNGSTRKIEKGQIKNCS